MHARWRAWPWPSAPGRVANPHDYALVYGSPVPGYEAPQDTVTPAARVSLVMLADRRRRRGVRRDRHDAERVHGAPRARRSAARLRDIAGLAVPDEVLARALLVWTGLFGAISYELFGHLHA